MARLILFIAAAALAAGLYLAVEARAGEEKAQKQAEADCEVEGLCLVSIF
ncbi:MAG: hypothetical protein ABL957_00620 [Parvularculaceae bacterium]